ncbi:hypothetical protein AGR5A_pa30208 [Agrobacterium genomosp. 5 str. CFBP 6626]|nr:hypothetical protein AGR5A_pa30208 [Agrobacterium genomosp. 5 str. CFBP 6626]
MQRNTPRRSERDFRELISQVNFAIGLHAAGLDASAYTSDVHMASSLKAPV